MQKVYDWVREKDGGTEIPRSGPIARLFPDGPLDESEKRVDIVVVTPKSMSYHANLNHPL